MRVDLYPVYNVYLNLNSLKNVDLATRGYYQVRIIPNPSSEFSSVDIQCAENFHNSLQSAILPGSIINGVAVSKTVELTYIDESLLLGDAFVISVQLGAQSTFSKPHLLSLNIELWSMDRHRPPSFGLFELDSSRTVEVVLHPLRLTAASRPLHFEYSASALLSITLFASVVSILPRRRKAPPDPPISAKLREYHYSACNSLFSSLRSIEIFIIKNARWFNTNVQTTPTDWSPEMNSISSRLEDSERPWATLEAETVHLSSRLSIMFSQLLHLTLHSEGIKTAMDNEYYEWRLRMLGEAFFFSEKPISSLLSPQTVYTELLSVVAKAKYLQKLPRFPIHCPATDPTADNCCIVFEERFLAGNTGAHDSGLRNSTHDTIDCIRNDAGDCFARKDSRKTIRLPRLRHRSVENKSLSPLHHIRPRMGSATTPSCELVINIENSSDSVDETVDSPSSSKRVTAVLSFEDFPPDKVSMIVDFVKERENVKTKLKMQSFDGYLYSELASHPIRPALLTSMGPMKYNKLSHLVVFVHGLEGTSDDLTPYRNALRIAAPDAGLHFLLSEANQCKTWADFDTMADNLLDEVHNYMMASLEPSVKVSFVAHSLGGIIVRAALAKANADWLHPRLHTLLTINSPHLGLTYLGRGVNWGLQLIQWWKQSRSMEQLSLRDEISFHDSFLFQLSEKKTFSHFKYVLLIGTPPDVFVPCHSSLLAPCKTANKDFSALGTTYREMLSNILNEIVSSERGTTVVRFTTMHSIPSAKSSRLTGRAAHIAAVEDDLFIEKLFAVSALKYFI